MAVWDKTYHRTQEALDLEDKVRLNLCPILEQAVANGLEIEDIFYIVSDTVQDWMLSTILTKRYETEKRQRKCAAPVTTKTLQNTK